jgi:hypothetical protein
MDELYMLCSRCQVLFLFVVGHSDNWLIEPVLTTTPAVHWSSAIPDRLAIERVRSNRSCDGTAPSTPDEVREEIGSIHEGGEFSEILTPEADLCR